ncbi:MAG: FapA family protein [Polyangiaceae bacterium]
MEIMPQARIRTHISEDGLSAYVSVTPGPSLEGSALLDELAAQGVTTGLLDETIASLAAAIADPTFHCEATLVAIGRAAIPPVDAYIEWAVAVGLLAGHVREDGSVDYHDREFPKPLRRGEELGTLHAPVAGVEGIRIDGSPIGVAVARKLGVRLGSGVEVVGERILSSRDGVLLFIAGQSLDVVDHHVHQGPVDLHCGNLNMQGSLAIKGDVLRPFQVSATGRSRDPGQCRRSECGSRRKSARTFGARRCSRQR